MQFVKLHMTGFKSFVEHTEVVIEPGITGVVGPNGCGKSNLVEALRWVMGEASAKQMRGGAMDDVIFNGTSGRPPRNLAEVALSIDNTERKAPAAFNDADELLVSRRIERESGSNYRVNGREVRARDVQLLFADAASGAHSPSMVSQGRIGSIINAKPTNRRALLEEAAGITGLHSRRHEAELRLRGAETNLERLEDVMAALEGQLQAMKRQARQANRYRRVGEQIRRFEAILLHLNHLAASEALAAADTGLGDGEAQVASLTSGAAQAATRHAEQAECLPALRQREAEAAARLHRLAVARDGLDAEERQATDRKAQLEARLTQIEADDGRETALQSDADTAIAALERERAELDAAREGEQAARGEATARVDAASAEVAGRDGELESLTDEIAAAVAQRESLTTQIRDGARRIERLTERRAQDEGARDRLQAELRADESLDATRTALTASEATANEASAVVEEAETARTAADDALSAARDMLQAAESVTAKLRAEEEALADLLAVNEADLWPPLIDAVTVEPGYETALGAALGDDLDVPADEAAPVHWKALPAIDDAPALPDGATPLGRFVQAPPALARRLDQIGVVEPLDGPRLSTRLRQGQRLVTRDGELWRWDGYTVTAGAEAKAAVRLRQHNRLTELRDQREPAEGRLRQAQDGFDAARGKAEQAAARQAEARERSRAAERERNAARDRHNAAERAATERSSRLAALGQTIAQVTADLDEARAAHDQAAAHLDGLPPLDPARARQATLRRELDDLRGRLAEARNAESLLRREAAARVERIAAIAGESEAWRSRAEASANQRRELAERRREAEAELAEVAKMPAEIAARRNELLDHIGTAETERNAAGDALAAAETQVAALEKAWRGAEQALAAAREDRVRQEAAVQQARDRCAEIARRVAETLDCAPEQALAAGGVEADAELPPLADVETKLGRLKRERDNMGPVNLRAEQEAAELEEQLETMRAERADLEAAIARLRQGISNLNREGRERLLAAFAKVDAHFQDLFVRLFGGGKAHLALVESDDPLEAGLEIMASPPGKRLQVMSLLSGGEQAMTALALLFAVFLTNPAPICVLDEVDAPLDDANVERFCNLLAEISRITGTRFLVITHHAFTMARMDRLFGVTMAERGVSQLVSVDLERAERMRATG